MRVDYTREALDMGERRSAPPPLATYPHALCGPDHQ